jgi:hypothetical protein
VGDDDPRVGGPRARALLARLAVEPGRVVGLDTLIEAIWDADPPAAPGKAVQALVSRLRRALPEVPLRAQAHGYVLDLPADAVDTGRFEALVARAREERAPERVVALLREAEALWRGPALADLRDLSFPGAVRAQDAEHRAGRGGEVDPGERPGAPVAEFEAGGLDRVLHQSSWTSVCLPRSGSTAALTWRRRGADAR